MSLYSVKSFFADLDRQAEENIIVEDDETLLGLALLVPVLFEALERTLPFNPEGGSVLEQVTQRIRLLVEA